MGIPINTSIDPTNAVCIGAAYYAGTKEFSGERASRVKKGGDLHIRASYNKATQENEETFTAKIEGEADGFHYRIVSEDGAFDSGLKPVRSRIVEDLPLREGAYNTFTLKVMDAQGNPVSLDIDAIQIAQGKYSVAGQLLPEDLSLVKDDLAARDTRLDSLFLKNTVLPCRGRKTVEVSQTIVKGSTDAVRIMIVEGPADRHASTNKAIGVLAITGLQVSRDLLKGTEIDLTFEVSESRDLTVSAFLNGTGQEFSQVFAPKERTVSPQLLSSEILLLETKLQEEIDDAAANMDRGTAEGLGKVLSGVQNLLSSVAAISEDDVTDSRFQLEDQKRKLAQDMFELTSAKRIKVARLAYSEAKSEVGRFVQENGNDRERHLVAEIIARESAFINSKSPEKINAVMEELERIRWQILMRTPDFLKGMFAHLVERRPSMNDQIQASQLIENGKRAIHSDDVEALRQINGRLWDLMPAAERESDDMRSYTGIM